jgi:hypothetical protein
MFWRLTCPDTQPGVNTESRPEYEDVTCPAKEGHSRNGRRLSHPAIVLSPARAVRDFTWVWGSETLISQRVLDLFEKHRITGFQAKPVKTVYPRGIKATPPTMFELVLTGWGGVAAPAAGVTLSDWCPACGLTEYHIARPGLLINPATWDGSDLFMVWPLPKFIFATERLANILRQEKISGVNLIPASKVTMQTGIAAPGPLTRWMSEDRARELSKQFGNQGAGLVWKPVSAN